MRSRLLRVVFQRAQHQIVNVNPDVSPPIRRIVFRISCQIIRRASGDGAEPERRPKMLRIMDLVEDRFEMRRFGWHHFEHHREQVIVAEHVRHESWSRRTGSHSLVFERFAGFSGCWHWSQRHVFTVTSEIVESTVLLGPVVCKI